VITSVIANTPKKTKVLNHSCTMLQMYTVATPFWSLFAFYFLLTFTREFAADLSQ